MKRLLERANWMRFNAVFYLIFGLICMFFPDIAVSIASPDDTDGIHWHMARCSGSMLIGIAFMLYDFSHFKNEEAITHPMIMILIRIGFWELIASWYAKAFTPQYFYPNYLWGSMAFFLLYTLANTFVMMYNGWVEGRTFFNEGAFRGFNNMLYLDANMVLVIGTLWLGFPDFILRRQVKVPLTPLHLYVSRTFGALLSATQSGSHSTMYFPNTEARRTGAKSRLRATIMVLLAQVYSQYAYGDWWNHGHWVGIGLSSIWVVLSGYCHISFTLGYFR